MKIEKNDMNITLSTSIRENFIFILLLLIGFWFICTFFYGIWYSSVIIIQALILNPFSFIILINIMLAIVSYGFFGPISFLITIASISSLINNKKILISHSELEYNKNKFVFFNKNLKFKISEIKEIKTIQDESSDYCQLLAINKSQETIEIDHKYGLEGMDTLNEIGQDIYDFIKKNSSESLNFKFIKSEFIPFIDEDDEEEIEVEEENEKK
ncbi:MAG: hypothetical protein EAX96_00930 [Candidatus Lokiarchaeota archaeon]|nr:hypothetical protein [Candidatus Lokiarchaeota archaeon]